MGLNFTVDALATYRLTKLVIDDEVAAEARSWVYDQLELLRKNHPKLSAKLEYLIGCPWCISVWAGTALFSLRKINPDLADVISGTLAASAVTGIIKSNEYRLIP